MRCFVGPFDELAVDERRAGETGPELVELLPRRLAGKRALVVMDTLEHLMPVVPLIYSLLLSCPSATFLVTSRSALRLRGEHEFPVPPLGMPSTIRGTGPEDIDRWPATALFWERAQAVRPVWTSTRRPRRSSPRSAQAGRAPAGDRTGGGTRPAPAAGRDPQPAGAPAGVPGRRPARPAAAATRDPRHRRLEPRPAGAARADRGEAGPQPACAPWPRACQ